MSQSRLKSRPGGSASLLPTPTCTGIGEYATKVDRIKLVSFLREQQMTEKRVARLRIHFVHRLYFGPIPRRKLGECSLWPWGPTTITICTYANPARLSSYTLSSQTEILYEQNETLMHELRHALDTQNRRVFCLALLSDLFFVGLLPTLVRFLLPLAQIPPLMTTLAVLAALLIGLRLAYRYNLMEVRARAFEKQYGRTYLLFSLKNVR